MTKPSSPSRSSLDELDDRLKKGRQEAGLDPEENKDDGAASRAAGEGLRVSIEFVVSVIVGAVLGYGRGDWAGNKAIGLVLGMVVGFAAGLRAVHRTLMSANAPKEDEDENGPH